MSWHVLGSGLPYNGPTDNMVQPWPPQALQPNCGASGPDAGAARCVARSLPSTFLHPPDPRAPEYLASHQLCAFLIQTRPYARDSYFQKDSSVQNELLVPGSPAPSDDLVMPTSHPSSLIPSPPLNWDPAGVS